MRKKREQAKTVQTHAQKKKNQSCAVCIYIVLLWDNKERNFFFCFVLLVSSVLKKKVWSIHTFSYKQNTGGGFLFFIIFFFSISDFCVHHTPYLHIDELRTVTKMFDPNFHPIICHVIYKISRRKIT